ncbi:ATP-binding protein [Crocosphaera sp.]|uniref:ATP-binding protein n=1 Tax=Crocosphaera sp. TaxID=2729996 RepID=UPI003F2919AD|nr:NB-ARC domain-containing protein [Crocosphaera sp.]
MDIKEALQIADQLVSSQTGEHLDDLQKAVIQGVLQKQNYKEIAKSCKRSESRIRNVAYQLWKLLSEQLQEDINKHNFRPTLERLQLTSAPIIIQNNNKQNNNHNFNFGSQDLLSINHTIKNAKKKSQFPNHDLTLAPKIIDFYDRETELTTLSNWIFNQNTSLISVLGLFGIGKTTLVKRFVDLNLQQFEVIIWKTLKFPKSFELLLDNLLKVCQQEPKENTDNKIRQLLDIIIEKKCLIILDDVQNIFSAGEFSGQYKSEYQDYQNFFNLMTEVKHQSHFILISQEQCSAMNYLDEELYPIKCLKLSGIENIDILKNTSLKDKENWLKLVTLYEGNTIYLQDIAGLIKDIYDGSVSEFLAEDNLIITTKMQSHFRQLFNRLSSPEKELILKLSQFENAVTREQLRQDLELSSTDFINSLQSLQKRYLVNKSLNEDKVVFHLSSVFKEYVRNFC